jgi:TM2 domain-containing membrane protein YozV
MWMRPSPVDAVRIAALVATLVASGAATAQREFVEEVDEPKRTRLDDVDLDAPDPAAPDRAAPDRATDRAAPDRAPPDRATDRAAPDRAPPDRAAPDGTAPEGADNKAAGEGPTAGAKPGDRTPPDGARADAGPADGAADTGAGTPGAGDAASVVPKPAPAADPASDVGGFEIQRTSYEALLEKWDSRAAALRGGEVGRAKTKLREVTQGLLDFGVQGLPGGFQATAIATALLREGRKAIDDGSYEEAETLVDAAELAAPDLVAVHTERALLKWRAGDVGAALQSFVAAARTHVRDPLELTQVLARVVGLFAAIAVLVLALAALLMGLPALRYLSFDLLQSLPRGAHAGQVLALVVMLALAPLVIGAGPVFGSLWILTLAFIYIEGRQRVVALLLALACLALPVAIEAGARLAAFPGSRAERAHRALFDATAEPVRRELKKRPPAELDVYEQAALALAAKREGQLEDAAQRYQILLAKHDLPFARGGYGVVAALQGHEEIALAELGKAIAADEHAFAAAFDVSVLHYRGGRVDKATAAAAPITKGAPELLNGFRRTTFRDSGQVVGHNQAFVDVYPRPMDLLKEGLSSSSDSAAVAETLSRSVLRGQAGTRALGLLGVFPVVWLVLFALRKKLRPSEPCVRCGSPASRRFDDADVPEGTCAQCFHAFISTRSRIDAGVKLRKERAINRRRARIGRLTLLLGLLFPGAGHFYAGAPVRGLVFSVLHGLGLGAVLFASGGVPMPRLEGPWSSTIPLAAAGAVFALVWLVAIRSAWALAEERRAGRS